MTWYIFLVHRLTPTEPHPAESSSPRWRWLPPIDSWKYHLLLGAVGMLVLGPLGGITAAYMNLSLGFFVGGQVLAGILGSTVTLGYGAAGRHGANYIQTTAASVAGLGAMVVVIQAMSWMGMRQPPTLHLVLYILCTGMFGAGVGMLYTPILVDRLQLTFPSGLAVANILRALTDPELLRRSVAKLGGGIAAGLGLGVATTRIGALAATGVSMSTLGAGMIVGPRVGVAGLVAGLFWWAMIPVFVRIGWLQPGDPFRKISFLIALGMILGASVIDLALILHGTIQRLRAIRTGPPAESATGWQRGELARLLVWVVAWGIGVLLVGTQLLGQPALYLVIALLLVFVFALVNGIAAGLTDWNPISSAFVVTIIILASVGLKDAVIGLMAGTALLIAISVGSDMQQDRSTGARLGTSRIYQFRYQVAGVAVGAVTTVAFASLFMKAYPVLSADQTVMSAAEQPLAWTSAMTYKFVGILRSLTDVRPYQHTAVLVGVGAGFATELLRRLIGASSGYQRYRARGGSATAVDFTLMTVLLPSPYASSFGGFVNLPTSAWFAAGSAIAAVLDAWGVRHRETNAATLPDDMRTASLIGGGMIAGDALAALGLGVYGLVSVLAG